MVDLAALAVATGLACLVLVAMVWAFAYLLGKA